METKTIEKEQIQLRQSDRSNAPLSPPAISPTVEGNWSNPVNFGGEPMLLYEAASLSKIDLDFLPPWLVYQAQVISRRYNIPIVGAILLTLTVISSIVHKKFVISVCDDYSHIEPLGIMTLVISTGSNDKRAIDSLVRPIIDFEKKEMEKTAPNMDYADVIKNFHKRTMRGILSKAVKIEVEAYTENSFYGLETKNSMHQRAKNMMLDATKVQDIMAKYPVVPRKIISNDVTLKSLPVELVQNYGKVSIVSSDSNLLKVLSSPTWLQAYSGGTLKLKIGDRYEFLDNTSVAAGLIISPEALNQLNNKEVLSKCLYFISQLSTADDKDQASIDPKVVRGAYEAIIKVVLELQPNLVQNEETGQYIPGVIKLSNEAKMSWHQFSDWIDAELIHYSESELLHGWLNNLCWLALRIAGLIHIINSIKLERETLSSLSILSSNNINNLPISKETMESAIGMCKDLITHAEAVSIDDNKLLDDIRYAIEWILNNSERNAKGEIYIRKNALHQTNRFKNALAGRVERILNLLAEMRILSPLMKVSMPFKTNICFVNPAIFECEIKDKLTLVGRKSKRLPHAKAS